MKLACSIIVAYATVGIEFCTAQAPRIDFTSVPLMGDDGNVVGTVQNVDSTKYGVFMAIGFDSNDWWPKPYWGNGSLSPIINNTFSIRYKTGGVDECADDIFVAVVPLNYDIPFHQNLEKIPDDIMAHAIATHLFVRPPLAFHDEGRTFAGREWDAIDMRPTLCTRNFLCTPGNAVVDSSGRVRLSLKWTEKGWAGGILRLREVVREGTYKFHVASDLSKLPPGVELRMGFFYPGNESLDGGYVFGFTHDNGRGAKQWETPWEHYISHDLVTFGVPEALEGKMTYAISWPVVTGSFGSPCRFYAYTGDPQEVWTYSIAGTTSFNSWGTRFSLGKTLDFPEGPSSAVMTLPRMSYRYSYYFAEFQYASAPSAYFSNEYATVGQMQEMKVVLALQAPLGVDLPFDKAKTMEVVIDSFEYFPPPVTKLSISKVGEDLQLLLRRFQ